MCVLPLGMVAIGAERMSSNGTCKEPTYRNLCFSRRTAAPVTRIPRPNSHEIGPPSSEGADGRHSDTVSTYIFFVVSHVGLVVGLMVAIERVSSIDDATRNRNGGRGYLAVVPERLRGGCLFSASTSSVL